MEHLGWRRRGKTGLVVGAEVLVVGVITAMLLGLKWQTLTFDPIAYTSHFADTETCLGVPNFWNVVTNLGFLLIGVMGLRRAAETPPLLKNLGILFNLALIGTAFGSAYFHWETTPHRLFWDQLPMSLGFGSFVGMVVADRVDLVWGKGLAVLLWLLGPWSVWNIYYGDGTTQYYLSIQFGSLIISAILLLLMPRGSLRTAPIFFGIGVYILAKVFESFDAEIFAKLGFISGHSLKHLAASIALYAILQGFIQPILLPLKREL